MYLSVLDRKAKQSLEGSLEETEKLKKVGLASTGCNADQ